MGVVDSGPGINTLDGSGSDSGTGTGDDTTAADSTGAPLPPCENGVLDDDETDVDCGGSTCDPCGPGSRCESEDDCDTMVCIDGFCQTPTCYDGLQNGSEDGVDCGGSCPNSCSGTGCRTDGQCDDGEFCLDGVCTPSSCDNGIQDTVESDVDCGGPDCPDCQPGGACNSDADCTSQVCDDGTCALPACDDTVFNGDETGIDCGGPCPPCPNGGGCNDGADCVEGVCDMGTCLNDTCFDAVHNGSETDTDCGGPECLDCPDGSGCDFGTDCMSGVCVANMCLGALCDDMVHNGDETDLDCGGSCGATCLPGENCAMGSDCVEGVCEFAQCSVPDCNDIVANGNETDVDCGGSCGATCEPGEGCTLGSDCVEGVCDGVICSLPTCIDMVENGDETDVDCGGACGASCVSGQNCGDAGDCVSGVCTLGVCQAPTCSDGVHNGIEAGVDCAGICDRPCPIGGELVVNTTLPDFQVQPAVAAAPDGSFSVVTWASYPVMSPPQDGDGAGVYARLYNAFGGPVTGELLVNATILGNQAFPSVDAFNTGFVVAWQSPDGDGNGIFAQRFNDMGAPLGGEIEVAEAPDYEQRRPSVAVQSTGAFVVCWEEQPATFDVLCRQFSAGGIPTGGEQVVHTVTVDNQNLAVVEVADSGEFTVAWQSGGNQDGNGVGIFMRRFTAGGAPIGGAETQVNQFNTLDQQGPAIGMNAAGDFLIAWSSDDQDGSSTGVYARRYDPAGNPLGGEFLVNTTTTGAQNNPTAAFNADGDHVIAWQTADDGVLTGVFAQRYDQAGAPVSVEFTVNPTVLGLQEEPDVAIRGANDIIGVWSEGDVGFTDRNIRMQTYDGQFP